MGGGRIKGKLVLSGQEKRLGGGGNLSDLGTAQAGPFGLAEISELLMLKLSHHPAGHKMQIPPIPFFVPGVPWVPAGLGNTIRCCWGVNFFGFHLLDLS